MNTSTASLVPVFSDEPPTLLHALRRRLAVDGDRIAYTFLADGASDARSLTWSELDRRAAALSARLIGCGGRGQRVLLALPSGLAFVESLFACWYAGAVAVPVSLPRHQRVKHRLDRIVADADAHFAISTADARGRLEAAAPDPSFAASLTWIDAGDPSPGAAATTAEPRYAPVDPCQATDVALLQYTSGSTGAPRGVIVTHANLVHNSATIMRACSHGTRDTICGWLPLFHDMGLIGLVMQAAWTGARCVFMSPERFLMRPWLWLQMISDYGACSSPAPNFAYDLCVEKVDASKKANLNLGAWRNALNGSEPVRASTLDRFAAAFAPCGFKPSAFFPCYGLAESTLFVSGPGDARQSVRRGADGRLLPEGDAAGHVSCGRTLGDTELAIVDPHTARRVQTGSIGEIWLAGPSVARGYWNHPEATAQTFNATLIGAADGAADKRKWLRTGDLGFLANGELFITGRLRDLIIIAGRNLFPVDLERTAESADAAIATSGVAAISVDRDGVEQVVIIAEIRRDVRRESSRGASGVDSTDAACVGADPAAVGRTIRAAIAAEHEVAVHEVVLIRGGTLPRTTSGKVSRRSARDAYLTGALERWEAGHAAACT